MQIALLDIGRETSARSAALDITNNERGISAIEAQSIAFRS